jgi:hypothetical protein
MQGLIAVNHLITVLCVSVAIAFGVPWTDNVLAAAAAPETLVQAILHAVIIVARGTGAAGIALGGG